MRSKSKELMDSIYKYVNQFCIAHSRTPSTAEISQALHVSKGTIHNYLKEMDVRGMLFYQNGELRTSVTSQVNTDQVGIPIAGAIPCGTPEEEVENIEEYISMPRAVVGNGDFFILRASGDSMVDAGIDSGDLVVVRRQLEAFDRQSAAGFPRRKRSISLRSPMRRSTLRKGRKRRISNGRTCLLPAVPRAVSISMCRSPVRFCSRTVRIRNRRGISSPRSWNREK